MPFDMASVGDMQVTSVGDLTLALQVTNLGRDPTTEQEILQIHELSGLLRHISTRRCYKVLRSKKDTKIPSSDVGDINRSLKNV